MTIWKTPISSQAREIELVLYANDEVGLRIWDEDAQRRIYGARLTGEEFETLRENVEGVQGVRDCLAGETGG